MKWEQEHLSNDRYTLEMVRIDDKVKQVITEIKLEEAAIAHRQTTIASGGVDNMEKYQYMLGQKQGLNFLTL